MNMRDLILDDSDLESLDEGGTWLCDLIAAVDYLRRGLRPGITVWDAIEEGLRWHTPSTDHHAAEPAWGDPDRLRSTLTRFLGQNPGPANVETQIAIRRWVLTMADRYNGGHHWPHPLPRRSFPPPMIAVGDLLDGPFI